MAVETYILEFGGKSADGKVSLEAKDDKDNPLIKHLQIWITPDNGNISLTSMSAGLSVGAGVTPTTDTVVNEVVELKATSREENGTTYWSTSGSLSKPYFGGATFNWLSSAVTGATINADGTVTSPEVAQPLVGAFDELQFHGFFSIPSYTTKYYASTAMASQKGKYMVAVVVDWA